MAAERRVAIVGAGLAGCLLATLLGRRGVPVDVYERRPDPRLAGGERGRSINLAISARGLAALEEVGLREHALAQALPMHGRMIHSITNESSFRRYSADGTRAINSISRAKLNESLLDTAEGTAGVRLCFGHRLQSADADTGRLTFDTDAGTVSADAEVVLGADGAYSATRSALAGAPEFDLRQDFLEHGYKELTIPRAEGRVRIGSRCAAHLAAGRFDDDCATQSRSIVHLHPVLAKVRRGQLCGAGSSRSARELFRTRVSRCRRHNADPRRGLCAESDGLACHDSVLAVGGACALPRSSPWSETPRTPSSRSSGKVRTVRSRTVLRSTDAFPRRTRTGIGP